MPCDIAAHALPSCPLNKKVRTICTAALFFCCSNGSLAHSSSIGATSVLWSTKKSAHIPHIGIIDI